MPVDMTYLVRLHLMNDQPLHDLVQTRLLNAAADWRPPDVIADFYADPVAGPERRKVARIGAAADALRNLVTEEVVPEIYPAASNPWRLLTIDIVGHALGQVEWHDLAASWLTDTDARLDA